MEAAYIVSTGESVSGMRDVLPRMSDLARAVAEGRAESAAPGTYLPRGRRANVVVEKSGADRAIEMMLAKIAGSSYETEGKTARRRGSPSPKRSRASQV